MFARHPLKTATMTATAALVLACSHTPKQASEESLSKTSQAAAEVGATHYTVINFTPGQTGIAEAERAKLRELAAKAQQQGKTAEFQVLAWADKEYPMEGQKVASRDAKIADQRATAIKDYLKKDIKTSMDVESHNMAQRPGFFSEWMKTNDFEMKTSFENSGAAPHETGDRSALLGNKASKAVVLIKYQ